METLLHITTFLLLLAAVFVLAKKADKRFDKLIAQLLEIRMRDTQTDEAINDLGRGISYLITVEENRPKGNPLNFFTICNQSGAPILYFYNEVNRDEYFNGMKQTYKSRFTKGTKTLKIQD